jgi:hypothetical protein
LHIARIKLFRVIIKQIPITFMALAPGVAVDVIKDILPVPASTDPEDKMLADSQEDKPTLSHTIAQADHFEKGAAQEHHGQEVIDVGWNEDPGLIENPLIGGIKNEDLWVLVRRFNKVRDLTATPTYYLGKLLITTLASLSL